MMRRRRGVGLLGTMAVGGVAYAAGSSAARSGQRESEQEARLQQLEAQQYQPPPMQPAAPPPPAAPAGKSTIEQLKELGELRDSGILTPQEFEVQKAKILASS